MHYKKETRTGGRGKISFRAFIFLLVALSVVTTVISDCKWPTVLYKWWISLWYLSSPATPILLPLTCPLPFSPLRLPLLSPSSFLSCIFFSLSGFSPPPLASSTRSVSICLIWPSVQEERALQQRSCSKDVGGGGEQRSRGVEGVNYGWMDWDWIIKRRRGRWDCFWAIRRLLADEKFSSFLLLENVSRFGEIRTCAHIFLYVRTSAF